MTYKSILLIQRFRCKSPFRSNDAGQTDWPTFGRDPGAGRFSPLKQINVGNVQTAPTRLDLSYREARFGRDSDCGRRRDVSDAAANGLFAIEPETGKQIWHFEATQVALRGLAYWPGDKTTHPRVFAGVKGGMIALDATTGKPATGFANEGLLDLKQGVLGDLPDARISLQSPPAVYKNIVITGSANGEGTSHGGSLRRYPRLGCI